MVSKLVECGFLSNKVRKYVDSHNSKSAAGLVGQVGLLCSSLCTCAQVTVVEMLQ